MEIAEALNIEVSTVFKKNYDCKKRIKCNQGGTRSTKTYSILQLLIIQSYYIKSEIITIVRKSFNSLKFTAMRDFFDILQSWDIYDQANHNKTDSIYELNGNIFEFQGLDQPQKKRGAKRNKLFINEANELTYEDWVQLTLRTTGDIYLDYNPSDEFSWIYDKVHPREDCEVIKSTYRDNPFLEQVQINEIERLKGEDENYWRVYGLGEVGVSQEVIYTNWGIYHAQDAIDETIYGLDFGFNHPTVLTEVKLRDGQPYIKELIYKSHLTNSQLIEEMKGYNIGGDYIYADAAEPARIAELQDAGFNVIPAVKDVQDGIDYLRRLKLSIHADSVNLQKEIRSYKWKVDRNGRILDEPVKFNDDGMDSVRYAIYTHCTISQPIIVQHHR